MFYFLIYLIIILLLDNRSSYVLLKRMVYSVNKLLLFNVNKTKYTHWNYSVYIITKVFFFINFKQW